MPTWRLPSYSPEVSAQPAQPMRVHVVRLKRGVEDRYTFDAIHANEKISTFKERIARVMDVAPPLQRLVCGDVRLERHNFASNGVYDTEIEVHLTVFDFKNEALKLLPTVLAMMVCATFYNAINESAGVVGISTNPTSTALGSSVIAAAAYLAIIAATSFVLGSKGVPQKAEAILTFPLGLVAGTFFSKAVANIRSKLLADVEDDATQKNLSNLVFLAVVLGSALALSVWSANVEKFQNEARDAQNNEAKRKELHARVAFQKIDADHSGKLSRTEFTAAFREATGEAASPSVVEGMLKDIDASADGLISQSEFVEFMKVNTPSKTRTLSSLAEEHESQFSPFRLAVAKINNSFLAVTVGLSVSEVLKALFYNASWGIWGAIGYAISVNFFAGVGYNALRVWSSNEAKAAAGGVAGGGGGGGGGNRGERSAEEEKESSTDDRARLVDAETEALVRTKNIFLVKMSLIMTVRFAFWTVLTKLDKLGDIAALQFGWDIVIMAALLFVVCWKAFYGQEIDRTTHDFETTPPKMSTFLPTDLLRSAGLLAIYTFSMLFGSICFVVMQDPIMAISSIPVRILVLWAVAGGLTAFMLWRIGKQREQILAEFQKDVKTVNALNSIRRNLMSKLTKSRRLKSKKGEAVGLLEV